jgi:hypothetical protein
MENPFPRRPAPLAEMFARWRKDPWPAPTGLQESLARAPVPKVELAARQEWEEEGGTVKPPIAPGPKLPL